MPPSLYENKYWRQGALISLRKIPFAKKIMSISPFWFGRVMWVINYKVLRDNTVAHQNVSDPHLHQDRHCNFVVVSCLKCLPATSIGLTEILL